MREVKPLTKSRAKGQVEISPEQSPTDASARREVKARNSAKKPASQQATPLPPISHGSSAGVDRRQAQRFKRGKTPIEGRLDLHGMTQQAAHEALRRFIADAAASGKRCVLVITGKGRDGPEGGVLRQQVPRWLNEPDLRGKVLSFDHAQPKDGGSGAIYVLLRRSRP